MTASLYTKGLLRPTDELIRAIGEHDIHEATLKLQFFDGKHYGVTHAMGAIFIAERRDLREQKGLRPPATYDDLVKLAAALTEDGKRYGITMPGEKLYMGFSFPAPGSCPHTPRSPTSFACFSRRTSRPTSRTASSSPSPRSR